MALIGEMQYLTIGDSTYSLPQGGGEGGGGTVTSVQVQATSPVQSSTSTAQTATLNTTISLANGYGDTKNPYASKSKNLVLASPKNASGTPSFRALDASDIPDLSGTYLTSYTETDPTVPAWAKASTKPTYTASEVGALPDTTSIPTKTSDLTNDSGFITSGDIPEGSAASTTTPKMDGTATVGTEMAFARGDHRHPTDTSRVPTTRTVNGKALSSNITLSASDVGALPDSTSIPTKVSDLTNDSGFITGYTETDPTVPSWAKQSTKPTYTASEVGALPSTTTIPSAGTGSSYPTMDGTRSLGSNAGFARVDHVHPTDTSRVPTSRTVNGKALSSNISLTASDVGALSSDTTIPSKTSDLTNDSGFITSADIPEGSAASTTTPKMNGTAAVGTEMAFARGDHVHPSDTSRVPTTRTVNGKALSSNITLSASDVGALSSSTSIPSKTSDLTNDSGFITSYTETDPTVPSWAKASTKPSYTASEVGAVSLTSGYATDSELLAAETIALWEDILGIS